MFEWLSAMSLRKKRATLSRTERVRDVIAIKQVLKLKNFQKSDGTTLNRVPMDESFIYFKIIPKNPVINPGAP